MKCVVKMEGNPKFRFMQRSDIGRELNEKRKILFGKKPRQPSCNRKSNVTRTTRETTRLKYIFEGWRK